MASIIPFDSVESSVVQICSSLGYPSLREQQKQAILAFVAKKDVFVSLPTGYGKSIIYGCLPPLFDLLRGATTPSSIVIVICPLIALMKDQVLKFRSIGLQAAYVGDASFDNANFIKGVVKLIFISPESFNRGSLWRDIIKSDVYQKNIVGLVVDEAHLVKTWGDEYRPDFSRLSEIRSLLPQKVNVLALTATATLALQKDVTKKLGMLDPTVIDLSPEKHNLYFSVSEKVEETIQCVILELKEKRISMDRVLIFCRRPLDCASLWMQFHAHLGEDMTDPPGESIRNPMSRLVDYFTGCTEEAVRDAILKQYSTQSCLRIVIATVAFGLGINCPDVRRVIHFGVPENIETYVQQVGRAGRDGNTSYCTLLYGKRVYKRFCNKAIRDYCKNKIKCRRNYLYGLFRSFTPSSNKQYRTCKCCDM